MAYTFLALGRGILTPHFLDSVIPLLKSSTNPIVLSGGRGKFYPRYWQTEAERMYNHLISSGIEKSRLHKEEESTSTIENLKFSYPTLKSLGTTEVGLITAREHAHRALNLAELILPYKITPIPARNFPLLWLPEFYFRIKLELQKAEQIEKFGSLEHMFE